MLVAPSVGPLKPSVGCQTKTAADRSWKAPLDVGKPIGGVEEVAKVTVGVLVVGAW